MRTVTAVTRSVTRTVTATPGGSRSGGRLALARASLLLPRDVRRRFGAPRQLQLLEQTAHVRLHRVLAQEQFGADLAIGLALSDQRQNLALLRRRSTRRIPARDRAAHPP